ncbi:MAG: putative amidohydrolase [Bacteroidia bacterium]|jgi:predicted amidohydrolase
MIIALAQTKSIKGDIEKNIKNHIRFIEKCAQFKVDLICFPELSLTGYEPQLAEQFGTNPEDSRLMVLQEKSKLYKMIIACGAPLAIEDKRYISMFIYQPNVQPIVYNKQILHEDEIPFFAEGTQQVMIKTHDLRIAPAICYESVQTSHFEHAVSIGCQVYLASAAKPQNAVSKAKGYFKNLSKGSALPVLFCNAIGACDDFISAGQSAVWYNGNQLAVLDSTNEGLILFNTDLKTAKCTTL